MDLWSRLATKLTGTQTVPEALEAYQKYVAERMQMTAEDAITTSICPRSLRNAAFASSSVVAVPLVHSPA